MPERSVDGALSDRGHTVNSAETGFSTAVRCVYDAATMQISSPFSIALIATMAVLGATNAAHGADTSAVTGITLTATRAVGSEAVRIAGKAPAAQPLEATLYATFSQDLPTVLLSRRAVPTDADGRYDAALPISPAFFSSAIVTIVVRSLPAGPGARAVVTIGPPNLPAPPDAFPPNVR